MDFLLAYATSLAAFMPYILPGIKVILRNRNYDIEHLGQRTSLLCSSFRWRIQVTTLFTAAVVLQSLTERNKLSHSWLMEILLLILSVVSPFNGVFQPSTSYAQAGDTQPCAQRGPPTAALLPVSFSLLLQSFDLFLPGMI